MIPRHQRGKLRYEILITDDERKIRETLGDYMNAKGIIERYSGLFRLKKSVPGVNLFGLHFLFIKPVLCD